MTSVARDRSGDEEQPGLVTVRGTLGRGAAGRAGGVKVCLAEGQPVRGVGGRHERYPALQAHSAQIPSGSR